MSDSQNPKDRLYLALYVRDGISTKSQKEDRYHWALLAIPDQSNQATRFHARNYFDSPDQAHWIYEEIHISARSTAKLLAKTYIGDVADEERLYEILRDTPVKQDEGWNCVRWIEKAMEMVWEDEVLQNGRIDGLISLKREALRAADAEVARKESLVKAML